MGNRSSSNNSSNNRHPDPPPPILTAAVTGNLHQFKTLWNNNDTENNNNNNNNTTTTTTTNNNTMIRYQKDRQDNNVLHALFSCRKTDGSIQEILNLIHETLSSSSDEEDNIIMKLYNERNNLGCTPIWILIAYGNVPVLEHVQEKLFSSPNNSKLNILDMIMIPNYQGDTCLLATCSQGNIDMVQYIKEKLFVVLTKNNNNNNNNNNQKEEEEELFTTLLNQENSKGTTCLQIVVGNSHLELLEYLLQKCYSTTQQEAMLYKTNAAGLSLFHICSERNFDKGLRILLNHVITNNNNNKKNNNDDNDTDYSITKLKQILAIKDKNNANAIHVSAFCGNEQVIQVWVDVIEQAVTKQQAPSSSPSPSSAAATTTSCKETLTRKENLYHELIDQMDGQARTPYWLAMIQGHEIIGKILASYDGVDTTHPKMIQEIEEAQQRRIEKKRNNNIGSGGGGGLFRPAAIDGRAAFS